MLWHIMKIYARYGLTDFIVCLGYKGYMIKEYFVNFFLHNSDITVDTADNKITFLQNYRRALARNPHRYRRKHPDWRTSEARAVLSSTDGAILLYLWRRRCRCRYCRR